MNPLWWIVISVFGTLLGIKYVLIPGLGWLVRRLDTRIERREREARESCLMVAEKLRRAAGTMRRMGQDPEAASKFEDFASQLERNEERIVQREKGL